MRNLKKILALVLAMVMTLSVMSVAGAFTDDEKIGETYAPATTVLSGLKVFQGRPDGSFDPQGSITRAEVAAIIYRIATGDVDNKQVSIYADYNKFPDVTNDKWFAGYVNYCANAEYVKGRPDGKFDPDATVTGYEALAMILRAIGYDANDEFTGPNWAVNTASIANQRGITKNVNEGTLNTAASREVVAELLFRTVLVDTVRYEPAFGYKQNETSLGNQVFGLHYFEDVVMANEYADLDDSEALPEGKTQIGETVYNCSTELTDIGESRYGWAAKKDVLYIADTGYNTVFQTGAASDISAKAFKKTTGMSDGAEYYLNFDGETGVHVSDYKIKYVVTDAAAVVEADTKAEAEKAFATTYGFDVDDVTAEATASDEWIVTLNKTHTVQIRPDEKISAVDMLCIKEIFYAADLTEAEKKDADEIVIGEVYVGTQSKTDISDEISYKTFCKEYLDSDTTYASFNKTVNGDWLKVVDNNGDGKADYVFKTVFTMAGVTGLSKKGVLTLTAGTDNHDTDKSVSFKSSEYTTSAELAVGDVVLYTTIDGMTYVELAPSFSGKVDKYTYKTEVLTVEGEDYEASGIEEHTGYLWELESAKKKTDYVYFQDWFGYIRAYAVPGSAAGELVLLTDAYFETNRNGKVYAVAAYLDDEIKDYDVSAKATGEFINDQNNDKNGWGKLETFSDYNRAQYNNRYDTDSKTNLALYSLDEDGVMSLASAKTYNYNGRGQITGIKTDYVDLKDVDFAAGETDFEGTYTLAKDDAGMRADTGSVTVQANNSTVFYYVSYANDVPVVKAVTGYKNSMGVVDEIFDINDMYAVATNVNADSNKAPYWVADAIVIETEYPVFASANDVVLGYNVQNKTVKDFGDLEVVKGDASLAELYVEMVNGVSGGHTINYNGVKYDTIPTPVFYFNTEVDDGAYINAIEKNFAKYGIYVARVDRKVDLDDYITALDSAKTHLWYTEDTVVYDLYEASKGRANLITDEDDDGDELGLDVGGYYIIYAVKSDIKYAILVDSITEEDLIIDAHYTEDKDVAHDLFLQIYADANTKATDYVALATELIASKDEWIPADRTYAEVVYNELKDAKAGTVEAILAAELKKAIDAYDTEAEAAAALKKYVEDAKDALDEAVKSYEDVEAVKEAYDAAVAELEKLTEVPEGEYEVPEAVTKAVEAAKEATAKVADAKGLKEAAANEKVTEVILTADIELDTTVQFNGTVTLDGNGKTITYTGTKTGDTNSAIVVAGKGSVVKNLTVESDQAIGSWDSCYGVQVYNTTDVTIEDVTVSGCNGGIMVNGSDVTLKGTINVSGNTAGGIEVSKGAACDKTSTLTVEGEVINTTESETNPTAWTECEANGQNAQGTVKGTDWTKVYKNMGTEDKPKHQIFWFMDSSIIA